MLAPIGNPGPTPLASIGTLWLGDNGANPQKNSFLQLFPVVEKITIAAIGLKLLGLSSNTCKIWAPPIIGTSNEFQQLLIPKSFTSHMDPTIINMQTLRFDFLRCHSAKLFLSCSEQFCALFLASSSPPRCADFFPPSCAEHFRRAFLPRFCCLHFPRLLAFPSSSCQFGCVATQFVQVLASALFCELSGSGLCPSLGFSGQCFLSFAHLSEPRFSSFRVELGFAEFRVVPPRCF